MRAAVTARSAHAAGGYVAAGIEWARLPIPGVTSRVALSHPTQESRRPTTDTSAMAAAIHDGRGGSRTARHAAPGPDPSPRGRSPAMTRMLTEPLESLRDAFDGEVITSAQQATYDTVRALWNAEIDRHPAVIARCVNRSDVAAAVNFGREQGLEIAVRCGSQQKARRQGPAGCDGPRRRARAVDQGAHRCGGRARRPSRRGRAAKPEPVIADSVRVRPVDRRMGASAAVAAAAHTPERRSLEVCARRPRSLRRGQDVVGVTGFEPVAPRSQSECATKLRHTPFRRV